MSIDRHCTALLRPTLRRLGMLLLGVILGLRALALPLDLSGHVAHLPATLIVATAGVSMTSETVLGPGLSVPGYSAAAASDARRVALSGEPACHEGQGTLPEPDASADPRVCQIVCAVACAPLLLSMPLIVAHEAGERRHERAPLLPSGVVPAPEHRPPIA